MAEYIEREAILKDYQTICNGVECARCPIRDKGHCKFEAYIRSIPAADVVPVVRGKWIPVGLDDMDEGMFKCSECGSEHFFPEILLGIHADNFCSNCGAMMEES